MNRKSIIKICLVIQKQKSFICTKSLTFSELIFGFPSVALFDVITKKTRVPKLLWTESANKGLFLLVDRFDVNVCGKKIVISPRNPENFESYPS